MPALVAGACVALAPRFTASGWLRDVRRYGATWFGYTGKPLSYILATPEQADDADNPLRRAYGNEGSPRAIAEFARRFGVEVTDAFGPTEGGIAITPDADTPPGALGRAREHVKIVDRDGNELPPARFDGEGRLANPDACVGEIVNTAGPGPFEGYYRNPEATAAATRFGWYWTGDLGYVDQAGFLYFAGRASDWLRVEGENFPAAPIERALGRHPDVVAAAVYGVPDAEAGDQVMAALVLRRDAAFDGAGFAHCLLHVRAVVHREADDAHVRQFAVNRLCRFDSIHFGHGDIHDYHVGAQHAGRVHRAEERVHEGVEVLVAHRGEVHELRALPVGDAAVDHVGAAVDGHLVAAGGERLADYHRIYRDSAARAGMFAHSLDSFSVAGINDHIIPWEDAYRTTQLLGARHELGDLGDVFVADGHRPAGHVRPLLGVALIELHQELADRDVLLGLLEQRNAQLVLGQDALIDENLAKVTLGLGRCRLVHGESMMSSLNA